MYTIWSAHINLIVKGATQSWDEMVRAVILKGSRGMPAVDIAVNPEILTLAAEILVSFETASDKFCPPPRMQMIPWKRPVNVELNKEPDPCKMRPVCEPALSSLDEYVH